MYGRARKAPDLRRRWLAESVDTLCLQYPGGQLQVAYLDSAAATGPAGQQQGPATDYSVLMTGNPHHPAAATTARLQPPGPYGSTAPQPAAGSGSRSTSTGGVGGGAGAAAVSPTIELYRVRLPTNRFSSRGVIIGEGKPENQNHAVIFCFGEALQTIDMNQDNALAEALKMRNLLQVCTCVRRWPGGRAVGGVWQPAGGRAAPWV